MAVRKIKRKERENGMRYCTFCKPARVDAIWRDFHLKFACEAHKDKLDNRQESTDYSEADYQTWLRV
jgi:hypothetical protein